MNNLLYPSAHKRNPVARFVAVVIWLALLPLIVGYATLKFFLHDHFLLCAVGFLGLVVFFAWPSAFWLALNLFLICALFSVPRFRTLGLKANLAGVTAVMASGFICGNYAVLSFPGAGSSGNWQRLGQSLDSVNLPNLNGNVKTQADELSNQTPASASAATDQTGAESHSLNQSARSATTAKAIPVTYKFDTASMLCYSSDSTTYERLTSQIYTTLDECNRQITQSLNSANTPSVPTPTLTVPASVDKNKETLRKPSQPKLYVPGQVNPDNATSSTASPDSGAQAVTQTAANAA